MVSLSILRKYYENGVIVYSIIILLLHQDTVRRSSMLRKYYENGVIVFCVEKSLRLCMFQIFVWKGVRFRMKTKSISLN